MLSNEGKFKDRNPDVKAAGKCFTHGDTANECLHIPDKPVSSEQVYKFRCTTDPAVGQKRVFYGRYSDPNLASLLSHGLNTKPSILAGDIVIPRPKSNFVQRLCEKKEDAYDSKRRAPIGKSHDQRVGLPKGIGPYDVRYGVKVFRDCTAGELVSPAKSRQEIESETLKGLDLYIRSHSAYRVGETYDRKYDWSRIPKSSQFGKETPHDIRGTNVKKTLHWLHETQSAKSTPIVSEKVDSFRERAQPQVGRVHDPIKDTMSARISSDHTFGVLVKPDEYGAGDLIHNRAARNYVCEKDKERGLIASIRHRLKNASYHNLPDLNAAFLHYDNDNSGKIEINEIREICTQFNLPVEKELLEALLDYCNIDDDGKIDYDEFTYFLNWKEKLPTELRKKLRITNEADDSEECSKNIETVPKQIDAAVDFKKSSQIINATVGGVSTTDWQVNGIPTVRCDLPAPRIRRIGDSTNYGDESNAYGLMNPSIYSNHGVHESDFFKSRSENEIRQIFDSIGFAMTNETFDEIWHTAKNRSASGEVSVELFRLVLDETLSTGMDTVDNMDKATASSTIKDQRPDIFKTIDTKLKRGGGKEKEELMCC